MKKHRNLYLSPDEQPSVDVATLDPLDTDVNQIDTSRPRLVEGLYDLKCTKAEIKEQKEEVLGVEGKPKMIALTLATTVPGISTDGDTINEGFSITHYIGVTELPERPNKRNPEKPLRPRKNADIAEDIAKVCKSGGVSATPRSIINTPQTLVGNTFRCKVKIDKGNAEFGESNRIAEFLVRK